MLTHVRLGAACLWAGLAANLSAANGFPDVVERIKPSIVAVGTHRQTDSPPFTLRGTGFAVVDGSLIATNAHVVADIASSNPLAGGLAIQARSANGQAQVRRARLVAIAEEYDLAVLRIDDSPLPALPFRDSDKVREGQAVGFTGFPVGGLLGFAPATHRGVVSAITPVALPGARARELNEKLVRRLRVGSFNIFQLDATAYPGQSGSPVFDADTGEVLGVINMVLIKSTKESALSQPTGIAYAIPAKFLQELITANR